MTIYSCQTCGEPHDSADQDRDCGNTFVLPMTVDLAQPFRWDEANETFDQMCLRLLKDGAGKNPYWGVLVEGSVLDALVVEIDQLRRELGREPIVR